MAANGSLRASREVGLDAISRGQRLWEGSDCECGLESWGFQQPPDLPDSERGRGCGWVMPKTASLVKAAQHDHIEV